MPVRSKTIANALDIIPRRADAKKMNFLGVTVKKTSVSIGRNTYAWGAKHPHFVQIAQIFETVVLR